MSFIYLRRRGGTLYVDRARFEPAYTPQAPAVGVTCCSGAMHHVVFDGRYLRLPDHPEIERDETLMQLGGRCRCLAVREIWRQRLGTNNLPEGLREAYLRIRQPRHANRRNRRKVRQEATFVNKRKEDLTALDCLVGQHRKTSYDMLVAALSVCTYDRPLVVGQLHCSFTHAGAYDHVPGFNNHATNAGIAWDAPAAVIDCRRGGRGSIGHLLRDTTSPVYVRVGASWHLRTSAYDLGTCSGCLILDILTPGDVEHYDYRWPAGEGPGRWWHVYGRRPDAHRNVYVLAARETDASGFVAHPILVAWPAQVEERRLPDGGRERRLRWATASDRLRQIRGE